ncbi:5462_t:CDS:2 [Entrophospora sp. SA101]|nr:5462_t:CDS:2 [Entrophospora sp. SA101]
MPFFLDKSEIISAETAELFFVIRAEVDFIQLDDVIGGDDDNGNIHTGTCTFLKP